MKENKFKERNTEKGQAIILLTIGMVVLFAFAGLAIDASRLFAERRHVQNVTDNGGLAGALAICRDENVVESVSALAAINTYDNNGITNTVDVQFPPASGQYTGNEEYVEVKISSTIQPTIIQLVYNGDLTVAARSVGFCRTIPVIPEGFPPIPFSAYAGAHSCTVPGLFIDGNTNNISGPIHSNDDWEMPSNANYFGDVTYGGTDLGTGSPNTFASGPTDIDEQYDWPLTHETLQIEHYRPGGQYAVAAGTKYYPSIGAAWDFTNHNGVIPDGIYYSDVAIIVTGNNYTANNVTFVADGPSAYVRVEGNNADMSPFINNIMIFAEPTGETFCEYDSIFMYGNSPMWRGIYYSPSGRINFDGNAGTTVDGCLWAASITLVGNGAIVGNCADYIPWDYKHEINLAE